MYVELSPRRVTAVPGQPQTLAITISNTSEVISGYALRFLGADPTWVTLDESEVSLFPEETRTLVAIVQVPAGMLAGERRIAVQVRELTPPESTSIEEVVLVVPEARSVQMRTDPMTQTAGKQARASRVPCASGRSSSSSASPSTPMVSRTSR